MPALALVHEMYKAMEPCGDGQDDHSAVIKVIEDMAGERARIE